MLILRRRARFRTWPWGIADMAKTRCVLVTNVPVPYRLPAWDVVARSSDIELIIIYCAPAHIDTSQDGKSCAYAVHFLPGDYKVYDTRFSHSDLSVMTLLSQIKPDVVITTGYIPTFLYAFIWARLHRVKHAVMTDGTLESESGLTPLHRIVRRFVFSQTSSFIAACEGGRALFESYGVSADRIHLAPLCIDNAHFAEASGTKKVYDLLFCGRFLPHKNPLFALDVAKGVAIKSGRKVTLRYVGRGPLQDEIRQHAQALSEHVEVSFAGYLSQDELPLEYAASRVFLFPTSLDPWGVVANEACAAGLPCVSSPHTGAAGELIVDGVNGYVCRLDRDLWVTRCANLLKDEALWADFSQSSLRLVRRFTFERAAEGVMMAVRQAAKGRS